MTNIAGIPLSLLTTVLRLGKPTSLASLTLLSFASHAFAGSATWKANPTSNDWNMASNWTPQTVPNSETDIATFATSNTTEVILATTAIETSVDSIIFQAGASAFTIQNPRFHNLNLFGAGIVNNSGITQNFAVFSDIFFFNSSTAGKDNLFTIGGSGEIAFTDFSSADHATFVFPENTSSITGVRSSMFFSLSSTAARGTFTLNGGAVKGAEGAIVGFNRSTADHGIFIMNGGTAPNATGGAIATDPARPTQRSLLRADQTRGGAARSSSALLRTEIEHAWSSLAMAN